MFHSNPFPLRALGVLALATLLAVTAASAARGGQKQTGTPAIAAFDDLEGDAIQSDGLGPYDATIQDGVITVKASRNRAIWFDFSDPLWADSETPFGSATSGSVANATLSVYPDYGTATFDLDGKYSLSCAVDVTEIDDDNDGIVDRYLVEPTSIDGHSLWKTVAPRGGRGVEPGSERWEFLGQFSMPWGIEVIVQG